MRLIATLVSAAAALAAALFAPAAAAAPDLTLTGEMTGEDNATYREAPFQVPAGVTAITVEFEYGGRAEQTVIDLGLRDPQRFRGWSGGNKSRFTVSETWATPSYLPGPLPPGEWKLILGVPHIRKTVRAPYTARITFERGQFEGFASAPLKTGPGWYRGDLHLHTGHSDGSCAGRTGARVPCPLHLTLDAAADRGLDFVSVTEHNATSHHQALAELQPFFSDLLLIPGREITTFQGHANVFGVTAPIDFQLGGPRAPTLDRILDQVEAAGGLISLNHPGMPSGAVCMGCGWTAKTDYARVPLIEAVNGGTPGGPEGPLSGIRFWEARLNDGFRITGVGGSDNHDARRPLTETQSVGSPTTVVYAEALSQPAILAGLKAGRVFVDLEGSRDRLLDVSATAGRATAQMGGTLAAPRGAAVSLRVIVRGAAGGRLALAGPGAAGAGVDAPALGADEVRTISLPRGAAGWVRVDVRGPDGRLWLLGNPVYITKR
jgi:hypothetical protein